MTPSPFFHSTDAAGTTVEVTFSKNADTPRFGIGYWSIRGLGAPLTMMLCAAQKPFTLFLYDLLEDRDNEGGWTSPYFAAKGDYIRDYDAPLWNLPFCVDRSEEAVITQTNAVFSYLGRACGYMGDNKRTTSECEQLLCEIYDLRNVMVNFSYGAPENREKDGKDARVVLDNAKKHLKKFESWLNVQCPERKADDCVHMVGGKTSAPDFHLWEMLDQFESLCEYYKLGDLYKTFPRLKAFKQGFGALEPNQFYLNSWLHKDLPCNNCMARFGSLPGPKTYCYGESSKLATWRKKGCVTLSSSS